MSRFILIVCSLFVMSISVFGQDALRRDLNESLRNYDIIYLDKQTVLVKARTEQPIEIQAYGREFQFVLTPNDLRAANYRAVESTGWGEREIEQTEIFTYKGKLSGDADSEVRFTITGNQLQGLIYTGDTKFFINEAGEFSEHARSNEAVVYTESDLLRTVDLSADVKAIPA